MGDWENLPLELLVHLYSYLSRRDRLSCSLVCEHWRHGLDHVILWKTMIVHIDTDLMEPSTILLLRDYCKYIKNLEFGWAVPHRNNKWGPVKYKELTKKAVRFFLILYDSFIQISCLRIFNWFDFVSFQKVTYHLARFLKSCIEQLTYLKTFKLDYFILSCKLIDSILTSKNRCLENLDIILKETSWHDHVIDDEQWCLLSSACPNLKVTLVIRNVYHYGELRLYLKQSMPIVSLSIVLPRVLDRGGRCNFRKTLNLLVTNYHRTLEIVDLHVKNENEILDDILMMMLRRCSKLKSFVFNGYLENPQVLKTYFSNIMYYYMLPNGFPEKHLVFNKILNEEIEDMKHKRVQFTLMKRSHNAICSLLILN
ncbi:F-box only protein 39-like isoform X2 [Tenebrio molitor]|uniref:F-box only protein 39-like isoform X2 n=1 Tax=Tenebrio molitor TaxID=7067 RepID=UPI003624A1BB